jgi:hypothetical protein
MMSEVAAKTSIEARLEQAASLPEALTAGFDAFEIIRTAARSCQNRAPRLFAAFMTAADVAVDGREASPSRPHCPRPQTPGQAVRSRRTPIPARSPMRSRHWLACSVMGRPRCIPGGPSRRPGRVPGCCPRGEADP